MSEAKFQTKVLKRLKTVEKCWFTKIQAGSIRGIPDIIGVVNGRFFAWELKKSEAEANKKNPRQALQYYILRKIREAGGIGRVVYPENLEDCFREVLAVRVFFDDLD